MKHLFAFLFLLGITFSLSAQSVRDRILLDDGWQFAFGNASSPEKDFGCGTEYFNYLTKAASIHNEGPYSPKFNPEKWGVDWKTVNLPHDWVVDLPYAKEASHSHVIKPSAINSPKTLWDGIGKVSLFRKRTSASIFIFSSTVSSVMPVSG